MQITHALLNELFTTQLSVTNYNVTPAAQTRIIDYLLLLNKWNQAYNLTSITEPADMISKHILDSLAIAPFIHGKKILDVGTGAGLPGIPLALTMPDKTFFLLDSNGKKIRFLQHVIQTLNISNAHAIQARAEKFQPVDCFDSILSRAFTSLADFIEKCQALCCKGGEFLAMKGAYPTDELAALSVEFTPIVHALKIPGLDAERHLVCVKKI